MATGGKPPSKGGKPFLGADDLMSELDAWDATFDALHGGPEAGGLPPGPVMDWPAPTEQADPTMLTQAAPADPNHTLDDFDPSSQLDVELDDQLTLDGAIEEPGERTLDRGYVQTVAPDPRETDFSDVGAHGPPAAIGPLLGHSGHVAEVDDDDTGSPLDDSDQTKVRESGAVRRPPSQEDEVFTSASRPRRAPQDPDATYDEDVLAPPPAPSSSGKLPIRATPPPPPPGRTGPVPRVGSDPPIGAGHTTRSTPAIVRRVTAPRPAASPNRDLTPPGGNEVSVFAEQTKILHSDEIEAQASASRQSLPTVPPIAVDDDAYDDIEIDADSKADLSESGPVPVGVARRTAHVVRRTEAPTRPPPVARADSPPRAVIEIDIEDEPAVVGVVEKPASEDDFSDVAAAVGASDEDLAALARIQARSTAGRGIVDLDALDLGDDDDLRRTSSPQQSDDDDDRPMPTLIDPGAADRSATSSGGLRPPALTDLYPRVKTPTSVPPLGVKMPIPPGPRTMLDMGGVAPPSRPSRLQTPMPVAGEGPEQEIEPTLDVDAAGRAWPEQATPLASSVLDEACAAALLVYEREVATLDDSATSAALRIEAVGCASDCRISSVRAFTTMPHCSPILARPLPFAGCVVWRERAVTSPRRRVTSTPRSRSPVRSSGGRSVITASIYSWPVASRTSRASRSARSSTVRPRISERCSHTSSSHSSTDAPTSSASHSSRSRTRSATSSYAPRCNPRAGRSPRTTTTPPQR